MRYLLLLLFLTGCAGIEPRSAAGGAVGGAILAETIDKAKEVFTPHYPLIKNPFEVCDITQKDKVTCYIIPCKIKEKCQVVLTKDEWYNNNFKVISVEHSLVVEVLRFCKKNPGACKDYIGYYNEGGTIIIKEEKK